jgi:hypothetical protein
MYCMYTKKQSSYYLNVQSVYPRTSWLRSPPITFGHNQICAGDTQSSRKSGAMLGKSHQEGKVIFGGERYMRPVRRRNAIAKN